MTTKTDERPTLSNLGQAAFLARVNHPTFKQPEARQFLKECAERVGARVVLKTKSDETIKGVILNALIDPAAVVIHQKPERPSDADVRVVTAVRVKMYSITD